MEVEMDEQKQTETESAPKETSGGGNPMTMGMGMAKKMMAQMGQGGSPFEMMQKMMAQMRSGDDKPQMEKDDGHVHVHVLGDAHRDPPDQRDGRLCHARTAKRVRRLARPI